MYFPTGKLVPVLGTQYDFTAMEGAPLPDALVDDSFVDLTRNAQGNVVSEIRDLGANYGMRVTAMSRQIRAIQLYSPVDKSFIALEPQFNYGDPFGKEWHGADTGMVTLAPGESVTWKVQLRLFQPANDMVGQAPHPTSSNCARRIPITPQSKVTESLFRFDPLYVTTYHGSIGRSSFRSVHWSVAAICHGSLFRWIGRRQAHLLEGIHPLSPTESTTTPQPGKTLSNPTKRARTNRPWQPTKIQIPRPKIPPSGARS